MFHVTLILMFHVASYVACQITNESVLFNLIFMWLGSMLNVDFKKSLFGCVKFKAQWP